MKNDEIQKLIDLRQYIIAAHNSLDGKTNPRTAIIKQQDVAHVYTTCIRRVEDLLKEHVKIS